MNDELCCRVCGEPARRYPPTVWEPWWEAHPRYSHTDGTPLCPTLGRFGYEPGQAVPARQLPPARPTEADLVTWPDSEAPPDAVAFEVREITAHAFRGRWLRRGSPRSLADLTDGAVLLYRDSDHTVHLLRRAPRAGLVLVCSLPSTHTANPDVWRQLRRVVHTCLRRGRQLAAQAARDSRHSNAARSTLAFAAEVLFREMMPLRELLETTSRLHCQTHGLTSDDERPVLLEATYRLTRVATGSSGPHEIPTIAWVMTTLEHVAPAVQAQLLRAAAQRPC